MIGVESASNPIETVKNPEAMGTSRVIPTSTLEGTRVLTSTT